MSNGQNVLWRSDLGADTGIFEWLGECGDACVEDRRVCRAWLLALPCLRCLFRVDSSLRSVTRAA